MCSKLGVYILAGGPEGVKYTLWKPWPSVTSLPPCPSWSQVPLCITDTGSGTYFSKQKYRQYLCLLMLLAANNSPMTLTICILSFIVLHKWHVQNVNFCHKISLQTITTDHSVPLRGQVLLIYNLPLLFSFNFDCLIMSIVSFSGLLNS